MKFCFPAMMMMFITIFAETIARRADKGYGRLYEGAERRWVLLKRPRCDRDGMGEGK